MTLLRAILRFCRDEDGVGSIYMLALLPLFLMLAGFGMDGTAAFRTRDMLQSTADAAALAGALQLPVSSSATATQKTNAVNAARNYAQSNMSVAGFGNVLSLNAGTNGDIAFGNWNGTTFTSPAAAGTAENAMLVTVKTAAANSNAYPTSFLAFIGKSSWDIAAAAIAINGVPKPICIFGLHSFQINGGPSINLHGCTLAVNGPMDCNGQPIGARFAISSAPAPNGNPACGNTNLYNQAPAADPYAAMASNIPANPCGGTAASYPQEVAGQGNNPPTLAASNQWPGGSGWPSGALAVGGAHVMCGDVQLTGNVSLSTNETLVIENGKLDVGSFSLTTTGSGSLTIIMTGPTISGFSPAHNLVGTSSGSLNVSGPSSGTWKQMIFYQDPNLVDTSGSLDIIEGGQGNNSGPVWNVSGVMYMPKAQFLINGLVSPASNAPNACFTLVAYDIAISGGGQILAEPACTTAPTTLVPISRLVQ
ncbi:MAG TPA: pilus assembly protein TadG-related protein [Pseudolabrys sp.]|nr:pilus assembly protein TadG-related protein [Pseudolabrys sp.]